MTTLRRLQKCREALESIIVEFKPEELDDFTPLKPEEADEVKLAEFLQENHFSFLWGSQKDNDEARSRVLNNKNKRRSLSSPSRTHNQNNPLVDEEEKSYTHDMT